MKKIILCLHDLSWVNPISDRLKTSKKISPYPYELISERDVKATLEKIPERDLYMLIVSSDIPGGNIPDLNIEDPFLYLVRKAKEKNKCCVVVFYDSPPEDFLPKRYFDDVINVFQENSLLQITKWIELFLTKTPAK